MNSEVVETHDFNLEFSEDGSKIINGLRKIKTLGRGSYSKVNLMEDVTNKFKYAVKIIDKKALERKHKGFFKDENGNLVVNSLLEDSIREIAIMKKLSSAHLIKLFKIIHDDEEDKIYLVMECCEKGVIMSYDEYTGQFQINKNYIREEKNKFDYSEGEIRDFLRGIILGLDYLHAHHIIHRDIKPDNILIGENDETKITDFNVSKMLGDSSDRKTEGTIYFMAPECCQGNLLVNYEENSSIIDGKPLDIWALGVTTYILVYKELPFKAENPEDVISLLDIISQGAVKFPTTRNVPNSLLDLISQMLIKNPSERITTKELKRHPWINEDRIPLDTFKSEIVTVTPEEVKKSMNFFTVSLAKKCGMVWKRHSLNKLKNPQI